MLGSQGSAQSSHVEDRRGIPLDLAGVVNHYIDTEYQDNVRDAIKQHVPHWKDLVDKYFGVVPKNLEYRWSRPDGSSGNGLTGFGEDTTVNLEDGPDVSDDRNGAKARYYLLKKAFAQEAGTKISDPAMDAVMDVLMEDRYVVMRGAELMGDMEAGGGPEVIDRKHEGHPPVGFPSAVKNNLSEWITQILKGGGN